MRYGVKCECVDDYKIYFNHLQQAHDWVKAHLWQAAKPVIFEVYHG